MNYTEIYNKVYKSLLKDGYADDHYQYSIIQITRSAASEITYNLWRFLLACENHPTPSMVKQVDEIVTDTLNAIKNAVDTKGAQE